MLSVNAGEHWTERGILVDLGRRGGGAWAGGDKEAAGPAYNPSGCKQRAVPQPRDPEQLQVYITGSAAPRPAPPRRLRDRGGPASSQTRDGSIHQGRRMSLLGLQFGANSLRKKRLGSGFRVLRTPGGRGGERAPPSRPRAERGRAFGGARRTPGVYVTPALPGGPCDPLSHGVPGRGLGGEAVRGGDSHPPPT